MDKKLFYGLLEAKWIETCWVPQTTVFYVELLPAVLVLYKYYNNRAFLVADVGAGTGAGTDLLQNVTKGLYDLKLDIHAYDIKPYLADYASDAFPNINYHKKIFLMSELTSIWQLFRMRLSISNHMRYLSHKF